MNKLYNKIYKAVNEGIQKALLIDPDQNDVSINYLYSKVDNSVNMWPMYIEEINNEYNIKQTYKNMLTYFKNTGKRYKINNFAELFRIYQIFCMYGQRDINLSWIDTTDIITFITDKDIELPLHMVNDSVNVKFVKFNNIHTEHMAALEKNEDCNHPIIISTDCSLWQEYSWCTNAKLNYFRNDIFVYKRKNTTSYIHEALSDYNGHMNTYENINIDIKQNPKFSGYPAFKYLKKLSNDKYQAYMPSMGELMFIKYISYLINNIFRNTLKIEFDLNLLLNDTFWSSNENDDDKAFAMKYGIGSSGIDVCRKNEKHEIFPLFKKII